MKIDKAEKIIQEIESADEIDIMEFDFNECFTYMREMERCLNKILVAHRHSIVDWDAMRDAEKLIEI